MALGGSAGVSGDVLAGRDTEITWEDVYTGTLICIRLFSFLPLLLGLVALERDDEAYVGGLGSDLREGADFHSELERKLKMEW